jgi:membrane protein CcdC involved in cytochrome C biogenesis
MNTLMEAWSAAWALKLSLLPVLLTYFIFDSPALIRRITRRAYVPIYFMFFPLGHSDKLYAQYFNEDNFFGVGEAMSEPEKAALRTRIRLLSVASMIFATVIAPWLCGFLSAFYLTGEQFREFVWFLMIVKLLLIAKALYELRQNAWFVETSGSFKFLCMIYAAYLVLILRGVTKSYAWTSSNLNALGFWGTLWGLLDYAYVDLFINVIIVALATWAITTRYTDPRLIPKTDSYDHDESASEQPALTSPSNR